MLSDHFLILGCAVLFEMYLLSSCSPIPPTIAWPKPEKNASAAFQKEKRLLTANYFSVYMMCFAVRTSHINARLD